MFLFNLKFLSIKIGAFMGRDFAKPSISAIMLGRSARLKWEIMLGRSPRLK